MQDYNTIIGAIQMRLNKCPTRSVMDRFRIGSSTLNLIMSRYKALELTIDELEAMSPKEVENLFYPQKNLQRKEVPFRIFNQPYILYNHAVFYNNSSRIVSPDIPHLWT